MQKLLLALSVVLSACGGGGSSTQPATQAVGATVSTHIEFNGDSTQLGFVPSSPELHPPSATVAKLLGNVVITNFAVGGTQVDQLITGQTSKAPGRDQTWAQILASTPASVMVVNHGINDSWAAPITPDADYRADLVLIVRQAQAAGKVLVLETPNPLVPGGLVSSQFDLASHFRKVQLMRDVAAETSAVLCDVNQALASAGKVTLADIPDGVHPSAQTYDTVIGPALASCLRPLIH